MRKSKLLKIYLTALVLSFFVAGCGKKLPEFPARFIYEVDIQNKVCGKYKIVDPENLQVDFVEDLPLSECNGVFGFASTDIAPVLDWSRFAIEEMKKACK